MEKSFLVFDIETIEDRDREADRTLTTGEAPEPAAAGPRDETKAASSRPFPPVHKHKIIAIGALWLSGRYFFKKIGIFSEGREERYILEDFHQFASRKMPVLVTYNGRRFDVPVIVSRSLKYGLSMDWYFKSQDYSRRYPPTRHLDLCDILSSHGASTFASLDACAGLIGLGGKRGMDGSMVEQEYNSGNLEKIQNYCLHDVVLTGSVFLRYLLVSGELSAASYNECLDSLISGIGEEGRLSDFLSGKDLLPLKV